jgi:hypothetical protein
MIYIRFEHYSRLDNQHDELTAGERTAWPFLCAASMNLEYPMLFNVTNRSSGSSSHCGVLEFIAEEGLMYMPYWVGLMAVCLHVTRTLIRIVGSIQESVPS